MRSSIKKSMTTSHFGHSMPMVNLILPTTPLNPARPRMTTSFQSKQRLLYLKTCLSSPLRELDKSHNCLKFVAANRSPSTSKSSTTKVVQSSDRNSIRCLSSSPRNTIGAPSLRNALTTLKQMVLACLLRLLRPLSSHSRPSLPSDLPIQVKKWPVQASG